MNSSSESSFEQEQRSSFINSSPPTRNRFTLIADLKENRNESNGDSPLRRYLKDLQGDTGEKQNRPAEGNQSQSSQIRVEMQGWGEVGQSHEDIRKIGYKSTYENGNGYRQCLQKSIHQSSHQQRTQPIKPGIYLYKKAINLSQPLDKWPLLTQSHQYYNFEQKPTLPNTPIPHHESGLFSQALNRRHYHSKQR